MRIGLIEMKKFSQAFFPSVQDSTFVEESAGVADVGLYAWAIELYVTIDPISCSSLRSSSHLVSAAEIVNARKLLSGLAR